MATSKKNPKADAYFDKAKKWQPELKKLRTIALSLGLKEELKWGKPCYTFDDANIIILIPLKESCAVAFSKGALLKDRKRLLVQPGQAQATRFVKFSSVRQISDTEPALKAYIREAIENEKAGLDIVYKKTSDYETPAELQRKLDKDPAFRKAFEALTPGRQRGYLVYFAAAKQSKTREARIEKHTANILKGKGLMDRPR